MKYRNNMKQVFEMNTPPESNEVFLAKVKARGQGVQTTGSVRSRSPFFALAVSCAAIAIMAGVGLFWLQGIEPEIAPPLTPGADTYHTNNSGDEHDSDPPAQLIDPPIDDIPGQGGMIDVIIPPDGMYVTAAYLEASIDIETYDTEVRFDIIGDWDWSYEPLDINFYLRIDQNSFRPWDVEWTVQAMGSGRVQLIVRGNSKGAMSLVFNGWELTLSNYDAGDRRLMRGNWVFILVEKIGGDVSAPVITGIAQSEAALALESMTDEEFLAAVRGNLFDRPDIYKPGEGSVLDDYYDDYYEVFSHSFLIQSADVKIVELVLDLYVFAGVPGDVVYRSVTETDFAFIYTYYRVMVTTETRGLTGFAPGYAVMQRFQTTVDKSTGEVDLSGVWENIKSVKFD
jgi:hypothetical protein